MKSAQEDLNTSSNAVELTVSVIDTVRPAVNLRVAFITDSSRGSTAGLPLVSFRLGSRFILFPRNNRIPQVDGNRGRRAHSDKKKTGDTCEPLFNVSHQAIRHFGPKAIAVGNRKL